MSMPPPPGDAAGQPYQPYPDQPGQPFPAGPPQPPKKRSKAPLIIGIVVGVLVLCCGGGALALALSGNDDKTSAAGSGSPSPSASSTGATEGDVTGDDLDQFKTGDCMTIENGTNEVTAAKCTVPGAYKVLLRKDYTVDDAACDDTDATDTLTSDQDGISHDLILCIAPVTQQ
jgi:hypothetical protein